MTQKNSKRALVLSVLSVVLCMAMLIGTTFAWFTDNASTGVNSIQAGTLDIALEMEESENQWVDAEGSLLKWKTGDNREQNAILWEPGCTYELQNVRVVNKGNLALMYKIEITGIQGDAKLNEVIDWTIDNAAMDTEYTLAPNAASSAITIKGHMKETAGNEYQGLSIEGIAITVVATQHNSESDSFGSDYDASALYPDGRTATTGSENSVDSNGSVTFTMQNNSPAGKTTTVSFPENALTAENAAKLTLTSKNDASANPDFIIGSDGGAVIGSLELSLTVGGNAVTTFNNQAATVSTFIGKNLTNEISVRYVGDAGAQPTDVSYNAETGIVIFKTTHFSTFEIVSKLKEVGGTYTLANAIDLLQFAAAVNNSNSFSGKTVKLAADIDLKNIAWTPIGKSGKPFSGTFDGNDKTISNLFIDMPGTSDVGLFGYTTNGEVKNLTVHNATVKGYLDVGAIAGTPYTTKYTNMKLTGTVKVDGYAYVGGMFGKNAYANLTGLTLSATKGSYVRAESENYRTYVGGVVGFMGEGSHSVTNVTSNIDVFGSTCDVGGITGIAHYGNSFINCSSSGNVTLTDASAGYELEIGGIAGVWHNQSGQNVTFTSCSYTGTLSSYNKETGATVTEFSNNGLVGRAYNMTGTGELIIN